MANVGVKGHENIGGAYLRRLGAFRGERARTPGHRRLTVPTSARPGRMHARLPAVTRTLRPPSCTLGFSNKVAELVEAHVLVKRYLTFKYPDYYTGLSEASKTTLKYQVRGWEPSSTIASSFRPPRPAAAADLTSRARGWGRTAAGRPRAGH